MKSALPLLTVLALTLANPASATIVLINNGLGPGDDPANSLPDDTTAGAAVVVRAAGCGSQAEPVLTPCLDPGSPTAIEILSGASVGSLDVWERSRAEITGGTISGAVKSFFDSHLRVQDGLLSLGLSAFDTSSLHISGGTLAQLVEVRNRARGAIDGGDFSNGVEVGGKAALAVLGGTLAVLEVDGEASAAVGGAADVGTVTCEDDARFTLAGGSTADVLPRGFCRASLRSSGHVENAKLDATDDARVWIAGGEVDFEALAFVDSRITIEGGTIGRDVRAHQSASISIRGGVQQMKVGAWDASAIGVSGGEHDSFDLRNTASITIYGSDFHVGIFPVEPGPVLVTPAGIPLAANVSGRFPDGTQFVTPFTREPATTLWLAETPPVYTSKVVQGCAAAALKALASAAAGEAKCEAALRKGGAALAKKRAKLDPAAEQAAEDKIQERLTTCFQKTIDKLYASWLKAQAKADKKEPGSCPIDATPLDPLEFSGQVGRLVRAAAPREFAEPDAVCLASDAAAVGAAGRYLADALKARGLGFKKGLRPADVAAADARLAKSADKLRTTLAKLAAKDAKAGRVCSRAHAESLIALADQAAFEVTESGVGVLLQPLFDDPWSRPIGMITETILRGGSPSGSDRGVESAAGNLVADAQLHATASRGADIAFMNPGGVRTDLTYAQTDAEGDGVVTFGEARAFQPFGNTLVTMSMTGAEIVAALEEQCQPAFASLPFLHLGVSDGFTYDLDKSIVAGECTSVSVSNVRLDGVPLVPAQSYEVTVNSFLAGGGDNFSTFGAVAGARTDGGHDLQALLDYFDALGPLVPPSTDRVNEAP